ncbi:MAG TPA: hypothetical protein VK498_13270, partial [Ferruginibacter sp.]|nr:hypothetical protein [Ferruginibacter sp.]
IAGVYMVNRQYRRTILQSISSRYFNHANLRVADTDTMEWLKTKIKSSAEQEAMNILSIIQTNKSEGAAQIIIRALDHPSERVIGTALSLALENNIPIPSEPILELIEKKVTSALIPDCIMILCRNEDGLDPIKKFIVSDDKKIRGAAMYAIHLYGDVNEKEKIEKLVIGMVGSVDLEDRLTGTRLLDINCNEVQKNLVIELMNDTNAEIRKASYVAAARTTDPSVISHLVVRLSTDEKNILHALFLAGDVSLEQVGVAISNPATNLRQKEKLISLCGRIGSENAQAMLFDLLNQDGNVKPVIKALYRSNYSGVHNKRLFEKRAGELLIQAARIVYMQNSMQKLSKNYGILVNSFQLELDELREVLLSLFALIYNREDINKVKLAFKTGQKEAIINAMEIIDLSVRKDLGGYFNAIYEPGNVGHRVHQLKKLYPYEFYDNVEDMINRILSDIKNNYQSWTYASSLYVSKKQNLGIDKELVKKYLHTDNLLLAETARYAL